MPDKNPNPDDAALYEGAASSDSSLAHRLLAWYAQNKRSLPWRGHPDPYAVWVSEIMLQQTRVETVIPYFERWLQRFPTLDSLAAASEQAVLKAWEGLGYYSRARNLRKAAQVVVEKFGGQLPQARHELEKLPGIGRYTAGAIASIAFGKDEAALDGNIRRVLARVFAMRLPARSPEGERRLWELAMQTLPAGQAGDFNQAIMDLGATICTPQKPACLVCPLSELCHGRAAGLQDVLPILKAAAPVPHYTVMAAIIERAGRVLIARRPSNGLLGGLWEFPGGKLEPGETLPEGLEREIREELAARIAVGEPFGLYQHAFTHFKITLHAFLCKLIDGEPTAIEASEIAWVNIPELKNYPMGKVDRQIAKKLEVKESIRKLAEA
jgi:A/G-specific adenine glycosylase